MKLAIVAPAKSGSTAIYNSCRAALSRDETCHSIFEPQMPWAIMKLRNYDFSETFMTKIMVSRMLASKSDFHMEWFDKRILLVRDVKDLMVSELLFRPMIDPLSFDEQALADFVKMIEAKERDPGSISVLQLHEQADELGISSLNWDIYRAILKRLIELRFKYDFSVVHFEDYAAGDYSGLRQVLGRKVGPTDLSTSWVSHIQRKGKHGEWRNWFTADSQSHSSKNTMKPLTMNRLEHTSSTTAESTPSSARSMWSASRRHGVNKSSCSERPAKTIRRKRISRCWCHVRVTGRSSTSASL
jgi:hypothetical protein